MCIRDSTDTTIHVDSHHPFSQKMAAYDSFSHRLLTIPLDEYDFSEELNMIKYATVTRAQPLINC